MVESQHEMSQWGDSLQSPMVVQGMRGTQGQVWRCDHLVWVWIAFDTNWRGMASRTTFPRGVVTDGVVVVVVFVVFVVAVGG